MPPATPCALRAHFEAASRRALLGGGHGAFLCRFGDSGRAREEMRMENRFLGYVCLVDREGVVRWHVHGNETPSEEGAHALREGIRSLSSQGGTRGSAS